MLDDPGARTAILVIDMVGDMFSREELARQRSSIVAAINALTDAGRQAGHRVVWIRQEYAPDLTDAPLEYRRRRIRRTIVGTAGAALLADLDVAREDRVVVKKRYSAFFETDLDGFLRHHQVDKLIIIGVNTHACIRTTAIDAYQRDYDVAIVRDCVASYDQEHHDVSLRYIASKIGRAISLRELLDELTVGSAGGS